MRLPENMTRSIENEKSGVIVKSLTKKFGDVVAVKDISFDVRQGEFLTLLGPSGSGKTTTLQMIAGFLTPTSGDIYISGNDVLKIPPYDRNIGMVFQNYALFPHMTVTENIAYPLKMRKLSRNKINELTNNILKIVKLPDFGKRLPKHLSGGQQQRVALARALVYDPPLLLMDEPLGALDLQLREHMQLEIRSLQKKLQITCLYVTHDQQEALTMSDRIAVFNEGNLQQIGTPEELYNRPVNRFVANFIGESNFINGSITQINENNSLFKPTNGSDEIVCTCKPNFKVGKNVELIVRPEKIRILNDSEAHSTSVQGVIDESIYIGEIIKYSVRISIDQTISVKQQIRFGRDIYQPGDKIRIGWDPTDCWIITGESIIHS